MMYTKAWLLLTCLLWLHAAVVVAQSSFVLTQNNDTNVGPVNGSILNTSSLPLQVTNHYKFGYGVATMQGRRNHMEDTYYVLVPQGEGDDLQALVGVYDGHGGLQVSAFLRERLLPAIVEAYAQEKLQEEKGEERTPVERLQTVLPRTFLEMDQQCLDEIKSAGSTALVAILTPNHIVVANVGDCRGILSRRRHEGDDNTLVVVDEVVALSEDHKPNRPDEQERVERAGGRVTKRPNDVWRLQGVLAMSRAFGDKRLKTAGVGLTVLPEIKVFPRQHEHDHFLVLASDGFWDVISNEQAARLSRDFLLQKKMNVQEAATELANGAYTRGSSDNITVLLLLFI